MEKGIQCSFSILRCSVLLIFYVFSSNINATAQELSNDALRKVSRCQRIMMGSLSIKKAGNVYSFNSQYKHHYQMGGETVFVGRLPYNSMLNLAYSDPHKGLDHGGPINRITYEVSTDKIILKIYDRIQLICEFDNKGSEKAPEDPFTQYLKCKNSVMETIDGFLLFKDGSRMRPHVITSCDHSKNQKRYGQVTYGLHNGQIKKGYSVNYYAPWQFTHNQIVTYDLSKIAKDNNITKKQLAYNIIEKGLIGIGTNKNGIYNELSDEEQCCLILSLWKLFGNPQDLTDVNDQKAPRAKVISHVDLMAKANRYFDEAKSAVQKKQRKQAVVFLDTAIIHFKEALEWCVNDKQKEETLQSYMSAYRTQTFNAYRMMKTDSICAVIYRHNYAYFSNEVRYFAPAEWAALEDGLGMIAFEKGDYNDAIIHLSLALNEIESNPDVDFTNGVRAFLVKSYLGVGKINEAKLLNNYILEIQPENVEAKELKGHIASMSE